MGNFCYLLGCEITKQAAVIDPGNDAQKLLDLASEMGLKIEFIFNTHHHIDHTSGNGLVKNSTGAKLLIHKKEVNALNRFFNISKIGLKNYTTSPKPDIIIDGQKSIMLGQLTIEITHTPGHTPGGICFYHQGNLFTGDTLFVGDSGRTDLPGGNRKHLGASLRTLMQKYNDETIVWPGHNYGPTVTSTLGWEKRHNVNAGEYGFLIGE